MASKSGLDEGSSNFPKLEGGKDGDQELNVTAEMGDSDSDSANPTSNYYNKPDNNEMLEEPQSATLGASGNMTPFSSTKKVLLNKLNNKRKNSQGDSRPASPAFDPEEDLRTREENLQRVYENQPILEIPDLSTLPIIPVLPQSEKDFIARCLQLEFREGKFDWPEDWSGNLTLFFKDIQINSSNGGDDNHIVTRGFAEHYQDHWRVLIKFFALVIKLEDMPAEAIRILTYAAARDSETTAQKYGFMVEAVQMTLFDKKVLQEDNWQTTPSVLQQDTVDEGGNVVRGMDHGGTHFIGRSVYWVGSEAIVVAFVRDDEIGDLWKVKWVNEIDTCDLEHSELVKGLKSWDRHLARKQKTTGVGAGWKHGESHYTNKKSKTRHGDPEYSVPGIERGLVMARSSHASARPDILWPARVMHHNELKLVLNNKRGRLKENGTHSVELVFLCPYWGQAPGTSVQKTGWQYPMASIFETENVEANKNSIQVYDDMKEINVAELRSSFALTGLAKNLFKYYVDAHRISLGFLNYAKTSLQPPQEANIPTSDIAELQGCHVMSLRTAEFPTSLLELPWGSVLHGLDNSFAQNGTDQIREPPLNLRGMLASLERPNSIGGPDLDFADTDAPVRAHVAGGAEGTADATDSQSDLELEPSSDTSSTRGDPLPTGQMTTIDYKHLKIDQFIGLNLLASMVKTGHPVLGELSKASKEASKQPPVVNLNGLGETFLGVLGSVSEQVKSYNSDQKKGADLDESEWDGSTARMLQTILVLKVRGEDTVLGSFVGLSARDKCKDYLSQWRNACERLFRFTRRMLSWEEAGSGVSAVLTDSNCNGHLTGSGSFERSVRLPAALKGARNAGYKPAKGRFKIHTSVEREFTQLATETVLPMVHEKKYLSRLRKRVEAISSQDRGVPLTDDSDGKGGDDTGGSAGSYNAAVSGVACALKAVKMVVTGQAVNAFCATRPPGHHAGTGLKAMKATSNGFCLLNSAASAAKYAVAQLEDGGLGLKRVCVIDFDVHHGNGTQDILCKTYDPRFLYVSMHAGAKFGSGDNDSESEDEDEDGMTKGKGRKDDIFPGRCGDKSPHNGVLNIPMGQKVTAQLVGQALSGAINNAVGKFSPDLIILSAGFDAHVNDPLGLGGLSASDFGAITDLCCRFAEWHCSGRMISVLEGGYGVPCCKFDRNDLFLPENIQMGSQERQLIELSADTKAKIGVIEDDDNADDMPAWMAKDLMRCAQEGFVECVAAHCKSLRNGAEIFKP
ncbi:hypothetical protein TrLO_g11128 [Triparma laevis f. longispina]|uniref:histone deacetylase n=1 Tax=Triparma laevis f. longispina TaxID=1714387 RepID=A0A9W7C9H9_9STRA|nr:hypothetical protein TrLO_g11128 [Triparma laevis f. longispina]